MTFLQNFQDLDAALKNLNLLAMRENYQPLAEKENMTPVAYLQELAQMELDHRQQKRIEGLLINAKLPRNKLIEDFDFKRIPDLSPGLIKRLIECSFIDRCENILVFGNPGTGKSHLCIGLTREWCLRGRKVLYTTASQLVQQLLSAKESLKLNEMIKKLDRFEVLVIDDISYVPYERQETDVLFVLLAERYEQRSTVITSNLVFSKWNQVFKDEMTTAAAIDRLVHHATILELNTQSYRLAHTKGVKNRDKGKEEYFDQYSQDLDNSSLKLNKKEEDMTKN
jgi:DNA replication protein DnaC